MSRWKTRGQGLFCPRVLEVANKPRQRRVSALRLLCLRPPRFQHLHTPQSNTTSALAQSIKPAVRASVFALSTAGGMEIGVAGVGVEEVGGGMRGSA